MTSTTKVYDNYFVPINPLNYHISPEYLLCLIYNTNQHVKPVFRSWELCSAGIGFKYNDGTPDWIMYRTTNSDDLDLCKAIIKMHHSNLLLGLVQDIINQYAKDKTYIGISYADCI